MWVLLLVGHPSSSPIIVRIDGWWLIEKAKVLLSLTIFTSYKYIDLHPHPVLPISDHIIKLKKVNFIGTFHILLYLLNRLMPSVWGECLTKKFLQYDFPRHGLVYKCFSIISGRKAIIFVVYTISIYWDFCLPARRTEIQTGNLGSGVLHVSLMTTVWRKKKSPLLNDLLAHDWLVRHVWSCHVMPASCIHLRTRQLQNINLLQTKELDNSEAFSEGVIRSNHIKADIADWLNSIQFT